MRTLRPAPTRYVPLAWAALLAALAGCVSQERAERQPLPTLREVRSRLPVEPVPGLEPVVDDTRVMLHRMDFARSAWLDGALGMLSTEAFDAVALERWRVNGLRVGVLPGEKLDAFVAALPTAGGVSSERLIASRFAHPLWFTPTIARPMAVRATLHEPDEAKLSRIVLRPGRMQLLLRFARNDEGGVAVSLTPHLHFDEPTIAPRSPNERMLDGRIFGELAMEFTVEPGQVVVVAPTPDEPPIQQPAAPGAASGTPVPTEGTPPSDSTAPADGSAQPRQAPQARIVMPLPRFGEVLLTSVRYRRPMQMIVVLRVEPERTPTAQPGR